MRRLLAFAALAAVAALAPGHASAQCENYCYAVATAYEQKCNSRANGRAECSMDENQGNWAVAYRRCMDKCKDGRGGAITPGAPINPGNPGRRPGGGRGVPTPKPAPAPAPPPIPNVAETPDPAVYDEVNDCWWSSPAAMAASLSATGIGMALLNKREQALLDAWERDSAAWLRRELITNEAEAAVERTFDEAALKQGLRDQAKRRIIDASKSETVRETFSVIAEHFSEAQAREIAVKSGHPENYIAAKAMGIKFVGGVAAAVGGVQLVLTSPTLANAGPGFLSNKSCGVAE